jgi:hypothetical protein
MIRGWVLVTGSVVLGAQAVDGSAPQLRDPSATVLLGQGLQGKAPRGLTKMGPPMGATVEVTATGDREAETIRSFARWIVPEIQAAALRGYDGRESVQMLAEFMAMDPSRPKPPTVGRFHYNAYSPPTVRIRR